VKLAVVVLLALAVASPAAAIPVPILWSDFRIGQFRLKSDTLGTIVRQFGPPDRRTREGGVCKVRWRIYGAQMTFVGPNPCGVKAHFARAVLVGRAWGTASRLGIDEPAAEVLKSHPRAFRRSHTEWWWLVRRSTPDGFTGLEAKVHRGRVTAFRVTYGAGAS
jgi:hypothetical protein